jgi:hypothetical protein
MSIPEAMSFLDLDVHLRTPEAGEFRGRCLDVEPIEGEMLATVAFEMAQAPLLRLGATAELEFRAKEAPDFSVNTVAQTVLRTDEAERRCYCFRGSLSQKVFLNLLGRRRALRTHLPPNALKVSVLDLGPEPPDAILHDVSAMGLSIILEAAHEERLFDRSQLRIAVRLPGEEQAIEIVAAIRHRRLLGSGVLYGLEIEGRIPEFMRAQDKLSLYVASLRDQGAS